MSERTALIDHLHSHGTALHARVLSRDDAHLAPTAFSAAAARRLKAGIAALESWLRRVLILMALHLEPVLTQTTRPYSPVHRLKSSSTRACLRVFARSGACLPEDWQRRQDERVDPWEGCRRSDLYCPRPVWAAPLLARLAVLKALIDAPEARARRLAYHLARQRPGRLRAPPYRGPFSGRIFGTEIGALHAALAQAIAEWSRARPPPLGPVPRAGPRLRWL